jgi:integrase
MTTTHLTDKIAREHPAPAKGYTITNDDEVSGYGLLVTANGARSWVFRYRHHRRSRRYTIGSFPSWNSTTARKRAAELDRLVDQGIDPQGDKAEARKAPTVNELADRYMAEHALKKRSGDGDRKMLALYVRPTLGTKRVVDVTFDDCNQLHRRISTRSERKPGGAPYRANRVAALLSKMFSLAIKWGLRTDNPTRGIERNLESPRDRYLSPAEIARLSDALAAHPNRAAADAIRMLLLSGARRMEVLSAHSEHFDLENKIWRKPEQNTKQKRVHSLPIEGAVLELVTRLVAEAKGGYLFPGHGTDHLTNCKRTWAAIRQAAELGEVRVHDLRHSFASVVASGPGASLLLIGKLLGHSNVSTTARYSHLFDEPQRAAMKAAGAVISGEPKAEVRPMRRAGDDG